MPNGILAKCGHP